MSMPPAFNAAASANPDTSNKKPGVKIPPGFVVDKRDAQGVTLLMEAARQNLPQKIIECLEQGSDINAIDRGGLTPIMHAANKGCSEAVVLLANKGADLTVKTPQGMTALIMTCQQTQGMDEAIETMIKRGAPLDERANLTNATALIHTIYNHNIWAACRLVAAGADFENIGDKQGRTAEKLGSQSFSGKDLDFFKNAMQERRDRVIRAAAEEEAHRENALRSTVTAATVLQRDITGMKRLTLKKPAPGQG